MRFGGRRRQCTLCGTTWRVWNRRRGRKRIRGQISLIIRFLDHVIGSSEARARNKEKGVRTVQREIVRSRDLLRRITPWPTLPSGTTLILLADATVKQIGGQWYTVYCMLIRRSLDNEAWIVPPVVLPGKETNPGWKSALTTLPPAQLSFVRALVCDGHKGLIDCAKRHRWLIQRCHFHILARIQGRRSRWSCSRHREEGNRVYVAVKRVLDAPAETDITPLLLDVDRLAFWTSSRQLRVALLGFINQVEDFRTYQHHPQLHLPRTNNTCESLIGSIESLLHRLRGISNPTALAAWIEAVVKHKKKITCNGFYQPNI